MKKILAMLMAIAIVMSLVACGSKDTSGKGDEKNE